MTVTKANSPVWNSPLLAPGCLKQAGSVLLLSLAMLAGLSLLATLAASSMLQQQQMAANHADGELARLSAISALRAGEQYVLELPDGVRNSNCQADCFAELVAISDADSLPQYPESLDDNWWLTWGHPPSPTTFETDLILDPGSFWSLPGRLSPMFIIEELEYMASDVAPNRAADGAISEQDAEEAPAINGVAYYRILGRGTGIAASSTHVVESILARPWRPNTTESESIALECSTFRPWYDCGRMAYRERR
ncbi:MAG: hypothetical protein SH820_07460 [Xanthomonadales bacterium]|nr:hypothetical protein [Xanthomonadales bacterium]